MEKINDFLSRIGVSQDAQDVYTSLFTQGASSVVMIARATHKHRPRVYRALSELRLLGLIQSIMKGKREQYVAAPPAKLRDLCQTLLDEVDGALPVLESSYRTTGDAPTISVFEGRTGVTSVFTDLVDAQKRGDTFYRISSEQDLTRANSYLPRDYRKKRDAKGLERFVITTSAVKKQKKVRLERAIKQIPESSDRFDQNLIELIYANKVAFIDLNTETSFVIENGKLADFHKKLFRLLYQRL
jgi:sugar-specific transcriptional regulator TrmB